ncbi:MAG: right-handed parallel beta-helix repeat-containing protein [Opitutus sp.]|nr:right-handed parallel beta-helix repeat-containing protein [Opitutus sp.]
MHPLHRLGLCLIICLSVGRILAANYHVDSRAGDDVNDGRAPDRAWRSIARVNATTFAPGDRILLRAGRTWEGVSLHPLGSGRADAPIVIGRFGEGPRPALHGRGRVPFVVALENQECWEIGDLEITNFSEGPPQRHRAIEIRAKDFGWVRQLRLKNLLVHEVNAVSDYRDDGDTVAKSFGGIVFIIEGTARPTAWEDLLVENCEIRDVGPMGLVMLSTWMSGHRENDPQSWFPSKGVAIRGNTFDRVARNGLLVRGCQSPLIERNFFRECGLLGSGNAMFVFHCDNALIQFNESCFTRYNPGDSDAAGFDADYNCRRSVFQFNYSHDNEYGAFLLCCLGSPRSRGFNEGVVVRYNLSQNDSGNLVRISGPVTDALVHNNTFYVRPDSVNRRDPSSPPRILYYKSWQGWSDGIRWVNNIFFNDSPDAVYEFGESRNNRFEHNLFFGIHPATEPGDAGKITGDPRFVKVRGADLGRDSAIAAYALRPGSAAIGAGFALPNHPAHDFAGRPVVLRANGRVDVGAIGFAP